MARLKDLAKSLRGSIWFQDLVITFSFANLFFYPAWMFLLQSSRGVGSPDALYFLPPPQRVTFVALVLDIFLLSGFCFAVLSASRWLKWNRATNLIHFFFAMFLFFPLNDARYRWLPPAFHETISFTAYRGLAGIAGVVLLSLVLILIGFILWTKWRDGFTKLVRNFAVGLSPIFLVFSVEVACTALAIPSTFKPHNTVSARPTQAPRIVWLLFDELAQDITFLNRPPTLILPELDRLMSESFHADNAYSPARTTLLSMPSYITGKQVVAASPSPDGRDLMLKVTGETEARRWSLEPGLFATANDMGLETGILGSYHPYCRVLSHRLHYCSMLGAPEVSHHRILGEMRDLTRRLFPKDQDLEYQLLYQQMLSAAEQIVSSQKPGVILVHWPFPHSPWVYDGKGEKFTSQIHDPYEGYVGNLILVDKTLSALRAQMEKAGTWDSTTLVVTSDHWWRISYKYRKKDERRIPFIVKLAQQTKPLSYEPAFNTVLIHDVLLEILRSKIKTPVELARWLDANRSRPPLPSHLTGGYQKLSLLQKFRP